LSTADYTFAEEMESFEETVEAAEDALDAAEEAADGVHPIKYKELEAAVTSAEDSLE
jgi:hypothetical protein